MAVDNTKYKARQIAIFSFIVVVLFWISYLWGTGAVETILESKARAFTLVLWSILLEALPFVLLGTIISSLIQVFVSEDTILRILPTNKFLRLIFASCIGLVFPVCECAIIPITRGLIKKGMPIGPAFAFMIATPIVNPVVLLSTYNAFPSMPQMVIYRGLFGFVGAIVIGLIVGVVSDKNILKKEASKASCTCHGHSKEHHEHNSCGAGCDHSLDSNEDKKLGRAVKQVIAHTNLELQSVGAYLIFGAAIAAAMQMFVSKDMMVSVSAGRVSATAAMMGMAFVLSLCSEADAFIASTFLLRFTASSVLAFLITGPMIDIKNTLMLFGSFKKKFVVKLILIILLVCFALGILASFLMGDIYA